MRCATIPEVTQVFVLGGSSPTGQREIRRASVTIKLLPKAERNSRQKDLKVVIAAKLAAVPDIRAWYVNERGERELAFSILAKDGAALDDAVARIEARMRKVPGYLNVASSGSLDRPELRVTPKLDGCRRSRHHARGDLGDGARRHHRRCRRQSRQVQRRRPAGADPRAARRGRPAPISATSRPCASPTPPASPCRSRPSPISASAKGRARSTATTATAAPPSAPISSAASSLGRRRTPSTRSSRRSGCPRRLRLPRPATPRSRAKCCRASSPPWRRA